MSLYFLCCSVNLSVCLVCCVLDSVCELCAEEIRNVFGCGCCFVACLAVFVNCLLKQLAMCFGVVAVLSLNVMDC